MKSQRHPSRAERTARVYGTIAFAAVVLAAHLQLFLFIDRYRGEPWQFAVLMAGSLVFMLLGITSTSWADDDQPRGKAIYFVVQGTLLMGLLSLPHGPGFFAIIALPLVAHAVFSLRWPWATVVTVWLFAACVLPIAQRSGWAVARPVAISVSPAFIFTAVFSALASRSIRVSQEAEQLSRELADANARLLQQSAQAEELATARERNRLAREIHDGLGHYLTVINVQIDAARSLVTREPARAIESLAKATTLSREALEEVRRSVSNLRQDAVPEPLGQRIETLCAQSGLSARCVVLGDPRPLPAPAEHALFRAAQEGLTNVRKHAGASSADLQLDYRDPQLVRLRVLDVGAGPRPDSPPSHGGFGLRGMRERISSLHGRLLAAPQPGGGFELLVEIPG